MFALDSVNVREPGFHRSTLASFQASFSGLTLLSAGVPKNTTSLGVLNFASRVYLIRVEQGSYRM